MKKIKLSKLGAKILSLGMAGLLAVSLTGCGNKQEQEELSLYEVMEQTKDNNQTDEILALEQQSAESVYDRVLELEQRIESYYLLKDIEFSEHGYAECTEEEKEQMLQYTPDAVGAIITALNETDLNENERAGIMKTLYHLKNYDQEFIENEGYHIAEEALLLTLKGEVSTALGMSPEEYENITVHSKPAGATEDYRVSVEQEDNTSNYSLGNLYRTMLGHLYKMQTNDYYVGFDSRLTAVEESLSYIKQAQFANPQINETGFWVFQEKEITSDISSDDAKELIKAK